MCVLIIAEKQYPSDVTLLLADRQNGDGVGIAWIENNKVHYEKGLTVDTLLRDGPWLAAGPPYLIHFRFATAGSGSGFEGKQLTHPFPVDPSLLVETPRLKGSANAVLAHNGHLKDWDTQLIDRLDYIDRKLGRFPIGPWSDTRLLATLAGLAGDDILEVLSDMAGKIAVFRPDSIKRFGVWAWDKDEQLWLSNRGFLNHPITKTVRGKNGKTETVTEYYDARDYWTAADLLAPALITGARPTIKGWDRDWEDYRPYDSGRTTAGDLDWIPDHPVDSLGAIVDAWTEQDLADWIEGGEHE